MSLSIPSRRVLAAGLRPTCATTPCLGVVRPAAVAAPRGGDDGSRTRRRPLHTTSRRAIDWGRLFGRRKKGGATAGTPGDLAGGFAQDLARTKTRQELKERMTNPGLGASPLLAGEMERQRAEGGGGDAEPKAAASPSTAARNELGTSLLAPDLQRALDPDPRSRVRWERKMVVRHVGRLLDPAGAETRAERLARTERALLHKSTPLPTSTKKLMHLARQIAGKTLADALLQMRFSKKKMAHEVLWHLEEARDMAIVERGMGLGGPSAAPDAQNAAPDAAPLTIRTKDGRWVAVTDPTRIYIDQAWVGKGEWRAATPDYRARGRRFIKWSPSAFLSVVLKEDKTRIRQHEERLAKEAKKKPWVHLPNRPVTAQRPYYSW